jgi:glucokinase
VYLGIDIGGTRLKAGLVDRSGRIVREGEAQSPHNRPDLEQRLPQLVREIVGDANPAAAGFGCKGIVDAGTTAVRTMPGVWNYLVGIRLSDLLDGIIAKGTPVAADNDAKAAMAGELLWGAARGRRNALLLTLGTGIGGAIVSDGRLLRGAADVAGHLGHITADPNGPLCICGNYGCLEAIFSARAIEAEAWAATHLGVASPMTNALRSVPTRLTCQFVFEEASRGDPVASGIIARRMRVFGAALAGMLHALDPEIVILSGSIAQAGPLLFEPLQKEVDWRIQGLLKRSVPLCSSGVTDTSGVVGAAALAAEALRSRE